MIAKFVIFSFVFCAIHVFASSIGPSDDDNEIIDIVFHKIGEYRKISSIIIAQLNNKL